MFLCKLAIQDVRTSVRESPEVEPREQESDNAGIPAHQGWGLFATSPNSQLGPPFLEEDSRTKIAYRKKGTLMLRLGNCQIEGLGHYSSRLTT